MTNFANVEEALVGIDSDAVARAWEYLEREVPTTAKAIQYLIVKARWTENEVAAYLEKCYGETEPKTRHKMALIVRALVIKERDS